MAQIAKKVIISPLYCRGLEHARCQGCVVQWVKGTRNHLQPLAHRVHINQLGDTSDELVRSAYSSNYARLASIKKNYDPHNVLRLNQNIMPGSLSKA